VSLLQLFSVFASRGEDAVPFRLVFLTSGISKHTSCLFVGNPMPRCGAIDLLAFAFCRWA
jgi:hypothetical protein